jgi:uncharacterized metal-binding protein
MSENCCSTGTKLLYTCSGASDVGELADRTVRKLWKEGFAQKTCLAGVGGDVSGFVQSAKGADMNITVDGCPIACARKCLERIGVKPLSIVLADFGYEKGSISINDQMINAVAGKIKSVVSAPAESGNGSSCGCGGKC